MAAKYPYEIDLTAEVTNSQLYGRPGTNAFLAFARAIMIIDNSISVKVRPNDSPVLSTLEFEFLNSPVVISRAYLSNRAVENITDPGASACRSIKGGLVKIVKELSTRNPEMAKDFEKALSETLTAHSLPWPNPAELILRNASAGFMNVLHSPNGY